MNQNQLTFVGKIRCGKCGWAYKRKNQRGKVFYICSGYERKGKGFCERMAILEDDIFRYIRSHYPFQQITNEDAVNLVKEIIINSDKIKVMIKYNDNSRNTEIGWTETGYFYMKF